ncbi:hypothetical protein NIES2135_66600 (plasmid) [Leptolyngbya boryana NIES-2135]|jgi:hypothetical protein|uniref:Uncharacterized protein n=1 Tax=Leptolyngbya boryana NIES-2135 TaxID=1973484 RepID=A0A1Z4JT07_LEPBY|nr:MULTISPECIES: hypothetical protein [Leptolyngbya]BAY59783.1 hypothetical protein NIES2135_66600 [Leptolyngbya boryana NIES-2135]MBD2369663.1 hypothetical protein [Leptolyngbya sp. FACHB-161]MBD2375892.1 hypothetical protein [Leptolyngbya sp. FACHB-238]MBD2400168.1 hypothetical protein [Leptolyngbya sp. FACHB-239]MBD2406709.1 hypothetical protein [Leptolyngbya sp. FACHB-402]
MQIFLCLILLLISLAFPFALRGQSATPEFESYLIHGKFRAGETALLTKLQQTPNDDLTRFSVGILQLMDGTERLMQSLYRYGLRQNTFTSFFPILRLPVPTNPNPQTVTYEETRQILQTLLTDLAKVRSTLDPIQDPTIKLPIRLGLTRMDFNGDGKLDNTESFWNVLTRITGIRATEQTAKAFTINFDAGDVAWLRGYCNLLAAIGETVLAYDEQQLFDATAHLMFTKPQTPYPFLANGRKVFQYGDNLDLVDVVAFFHLINFPVLEPQRLTTALQHLQTTLALSRDSWRLIVAEKDNDREWLPNPKQKGVIPNAVVTQAMIDSWLSFVGESEELLAGKKLVPFWRSREVRGINLNKVFTQPRNLDLVLWVQGTAPAPYLELGKQTDANIWQQLLSVFGGRFFGFAAWFN